MSSPMYILEIYTADFRSPNQGLDPIWLLWPPTSVVDDNSCQFLAACLSFPRLDSKGLIY